MDEDREKDSQSKCEPTGDYEVGYGRPPISTRFPKGQSGNPTGRPKGTKNIATCVHNALQQRITVREGGKVKRRTKADVIARTAVIKAMKGDLKPLLALKTMDRSDRQFDQVTKDNGGATGALIVPIPANHTLESFEKLLQEQQDKLQAEGEKLVKY